MAEGRMGKRVVGVGTEVRARKALLSRAEEGRGGRGKRRRGGSVVGGVGGEDPREESSRRERLVQQTG